jgi:hypothetical protein
MEKFWCVFVDGTRGFSHKHNTYREAAVEAERLARQQQNGGQNVYVLETLSKCTVPTTPVQWTSL